LNLAKLNRWASRAVLDARLAHMRDRHELPVAIELDADTFERLLLEQPHAGNDRLFGMELRIVEDPR